MAAPPAVTLTAGADDVLTPDVLGLVATLQRTYGSARDLLLAARVERRAAVRTGGVVLGLDPATAAIRDADWTVPPAPPHLADRRCEITGPAERKMMVSALNSGARVFLCDLEDALSPSWANLTAGYLNIADAAAGALSFDRGGGVVDEVGPDPATIVVRPRGLHLPDPRVLVDGRPAAGGLIDLAVVAATAGPAFEADGRPLALYLPKIESYAEAQWWDALIGDIERRVGLTPRSVRVTVLIETIGAALAMDEILYALRGRATGLNAGRWDYLFSIVKMLGHDPGHLLPDRAALTMRVPFMAAYAERLVAVCHRRGAHAIGGMAPFVPQRDDPDGTARALTQTRADKEHEAALGYDGTWVAHPALVPGATEAFDAAFAGGRDQLGVRPAAAQDVSALLDTRVEGARVTADGVAANVSIALRYLSAWLGGRGAVALDGRMEDVATAEIARCQLWQWIALGAVDDAGTPVTTERVSDLLDAEVARLTEPADTEPAGTEPADTEPADTEPAQTVARAAELVRAGALGAELPPFLTLPALDDLDR